MSKPKITFEDGILDRIEKITTTAGWYATPSFVFGQGQALRLTSGSPGRGRPRTHYLVVADTLPDCFRALGVALKEIEARRG